MSAQASARRTCPETAPVLKPSAPCIRPLLYGYRGTRKDLFDRKGDVMVALIVLLLILALYSEGSVSPSLPVVHADRGARPLGARLLHRRRRSSRGWPAPLVRALVSRSCRPEPAGEPTAGRRLAAWLV